MLTATFLTLAGLAAASPIAPRGEGYAPYTWSKAWSLVVNVTDISTDFPNYPIHGRKVVSIHSGAGLNTPTVTKEFSAGADIFFNSETDRTVRRSGSGSPTLPPLGLVEYNNPSIDGEHVHALGVNFGPGTPGFGMSAGPLNPRPCPHLWAPQEGTFVVCDRGIEAPGGIARYAVQFVDGEANSAPRNYYAPEPNVPSNCVAVKLIPQCETPAPEDGQSSQGNVTVGSAQCYPDVASINWSQYAECW
ncbi:hypothetical protein B0H63DRAFT_464440 [Podospora didyma]|uniref:DUF7907 domain-containing protein n=1 Tax=Podospora didyma TaxID=330526 RepID=A0AAE0U437_9PEZI|nr:hypothetical protein B0H63DRAFT_464440 [Podospora didyma]